MTNRRCPNPPRAKLELGCSNYPLRLISATVACLLFGGCSDSERGWDTKPPGARLTPRKVILVAQRVGETNGMVLRDYRTPQVWYRDTAKKAWSVFFNGRGPMQGNHFTVFVDDQTGEVRYLPGR